jgi:hypothetical protein
MAFVIDDDILHFLSHSNDSNGNHGLTDGTSVQKGQAGSGGDGRYGREGTRREPGSSPSAPNRKSTHHGRNIEEDDVEYVEQEIAVGGDQKRPSRQQPSGHSKSPRKVNIRIPCQEFFFFFLKLIFIN